MRKEVKLKINRLITTWMFPLGFVLAIVVLCSCGEVIAKDDNSQFKLPETMDLTVVTMEGKFHDLVENNPIDEDMRWEDDGLANRTQRSREYHDAWMAEIQNSLTILEKYLNAEDYEMLYSSYEGWKQYIENSLKIEQAIFYPHSEYSEISKGLAGGSLTQPFVMEVTALRVRNYAIELKSLEYIFTQEVEFVYQKNTELINQIKDGDFSDIAEVSLVSREEIQDVYKNISENTEWKQLDLNGDGRKDLIWLNNTEIQPHIVGIFDIKKKGECVFWDVMDQTEFFFITSNDNLVRYSQYFGFYDYVSYEEYSYDENWNRNIVEGVCAYNIYDLEIPYWLDEHNHDDMKEVGIYFKYMVDGMDSPITKDEFETLYEKIIGNEYQSIQANSDLFWLY